MIWKRGFCDTENLPIYMGRLSDGFSVIAFSNLLATSSYGSKGRKSYTRTYPSRHAVASSGSCGLKAHPVMGMSGLLANST